jgi:hypothetical protein
MFGWRRVVYDLIWRISCLKYRMVLANPDMYGMLTVLAKRACHAKADTKTSVEISSCLKYGKLCLQVAIKFEPDQTQEKIDYLYLLLLLQS